MAVFDIKRLPRNMVVRPSGTWDTRAPFHYFLAIYRREMRAYALSSMVNDRMDGDLLQARTDGKTLEAFLVAEGGYSAKRFWRDYQRNQTETNLEGVVRGPIYSEARNDLLVAQELLRKGSIVSIFSLLEAYVHSWSLNFLLAKAETGISWKKREEAILGALSPIHGAKISPSISQIFGSIDEIQATLKLLDANGRSKTDAKYIASQYCLFDSINFWRGFRNALVHNRGFCTPRFFEHNELYWKTCLTEFKRDKFEERSRLTVSSELLRKFHITAFRSAMSLEDLLRTVSNDRRGHPWAPQAFPNDETAPPKYAQRLLIDGDHSASLNWHTNEAFRSTFKITQAASQSAA